MITISLAEIKAHEPCKDGWKKLQKAKKGIDKNEQFPMSDLLETNDLDDCLWALRCKPEYNNLWRKYAVWCACQVQHLMADERSLKALDVAWAHSEGLATDDELAAAWDAAGAAGAAWDAARAAGAAWDAAARDARAAARDAAWGARAAARDAAWDATRAAGAAWAAAGDAGAAWAAARDARAARAAARAAGAAGAAARDAAWGARAAQEKKLKQILDAGEWVND